MYSFLFTAVMLTAPFGLFAYSQPVLPAGVSAQDWAQIHKQIKAQRFHAQAGSVSGGWQAVNPAHGFQIDYRSDGQH